MHLERINSVFSYGNYFNNMVYKKNIYINKGIRFGISVFGGVLVTYTSERYPTVVRSLGYGICIASGKISTL